MSTDRPDCRSLAPTVKQNSSRIRETAFMPITGPDTVLFPCLQTGGGGEGTVAAAMASLSEHRERWGAPSDSSPSESVGRTLEAP